MPMSPPLALPLSPGHPSQPLPELVTIHIPEISTVLNVVLHVVYEMSVLRRSSSLRVQGTHSLSLYRVSPRRSFTRFAPKIPTIVDALAMLEKYHIPVPGPQSDIWTMILRHAPNHAITAYALAAQHNMEALCVEISPFTLAAPLDGVSEADALTMGPAYLRRLFFLHLGRRDALKRVIEVPPKQHRPRGNCSEESQKEVARAWALAVAEILVQPMLQNITVPQLRDALATTVQGRSCAVCIDNVRSRVGQVGDAWTAIKRTI